MIKLITFICLIISTATSAADIEFIAPFSNMWLPANKTETVTNGCAYAVWTTTTYNAQYISVSPTSYWLAPGASKLVTITPALATTTQPGTYNSTITWTYTGRMLGDIDGDGVVNLADLKLMIEKFGTSDAACDLDGDGVVSLSDLKILQSNWNRSMD